MSAFNHLWFKCHYQSLCNDFRSLFKCFYGTILNADVRLFHHSLNLPLALLFRCTLKWVWISMLMPCGVIFTMPSACYYVAVYFMLLTVMLQQRASPRAGLCLNVKYYCCLHLQSGASASDRTIFNVILQQHDDSREK